jgi:hypothetical protein
VKSLRNVQLAERLARLGDLEDLLAIDGQGTDAAIARTDECGIRERDVNRSIKEGRKVAWHVCESNYGSPGAKKMDVFDSTCGPRYHDVIDYA